MAAESLYVTLRWGYFSALMLTTGGAFYVVWLAQGDFRRCLAVRLSLVLRSALWVTLGCTCAILSLQLVIMSGDWRNLADGDIWQAVLSTTAGRGWAVQTLLALSACLALVAQDVSRCRFILLVSAIQWCGMAYIGHAAALEGGLGMIQRANHVLHLMASALWVGGLPPLLFLMAAGRNPATRKEAVATMMGFSRYAHLWVMLNIVTGVISGLLLLGWPPHVSLYSGLLLAKVMLVLAMVALALFNRYWLVPRLGRAGGEPVWRRLVAYIWLEIGLGALVLALVSYFATLSPYPV
ncbi:copper homeostasis membrane protein CopD [Brenneria rubrifaciens]|uniref:Copper resistance protein D n=1 Tax=Brenneria rubrifaciens TaxID=55213 RepID=A0A4P8QM10_9GAMM|nr:copper homeostasis membrane protein CopD [Brenneria rubrifaciens]QCR07947.1 copper resistance D family protein [Brenneria rubrifaciens]